MDLPVCETQPMFHIGDVLRKLRERMGLTLEEVAQQTGMSKGTISQLERGEGNPRQSTLDELAKFYKLSGAPALYALAISDAAIGEKGIGRVEKALRDRAWRDLNEHEEFDVSDYKKNDIPLIAEGEASPTGEVYWDNEGVIKDHIENRISRPADVRDGRAYGIIVRGDSMQPMFRPGMRLIVSPNVPVDNGDPAYVQLKNGERLVKIVTRDEGGIVLESVNPTYRPRIVQPDDIEHIHRIAYARFLR